MNSPQIATSKKPMFGNQEKETLYRSVKDIIVKSRMLRLYEKSVSDAETIITVCNLWRLIRKSNQNQIMVEKRDVFTGKWSPGNCFSLDLLPIRKRNGEKCWEDIYRQAIAEIFMQHGVNPYGTGEGGLSTSLIFEIVLKKYMPTYKDVNTADDKGNISKSKVETGLIKTAMLTSASRALVKNLWNELIDRKTLKLTSTIVGFLRSLTLNQYIAFSDKTSAMERIYAERPNLMPLLLGIPTSMWSRSDLFSKKLWVKNNGKPTIIDRKTELISFDNITQQRWVFSKSSTFVRQFFTLNAGIQTKIIQRQSMVALNHLIEAKIEHKLLTCMYLDLLKEAENYTTSYHFRTIDPKHITKLLHLHKLHNLEILEKSGYRAIQKQYLSRTHQHHMMMDWLVEEGVKRGFPDRNSTLKSLYQQSYNWHHHSYLERRNLDVSWTSIIDHHEFTDFEVFSITDSKTLFEEGYALKHCVQNYDKYCYDDIYRIFSIREKLTGFRYTLGIEIDDEAGQWNVQQCYGHCNVNAPEHVHSIAKEFTSLYNNACTEQLIQNHNDDESKTAF